MHQKLLLMKEIFFYLKNSKNKDKLMLYYKLSDKEILLYTVNHLVMSAKIHVLKGVYIICSLQRD